MHHYYEDKFSPAPQLLCYSIDELLVEKTKALFERNGRARDVYDVVNISRNFRSEINIDHASELAKKKFEFKELEKPTVVTILEAIDFDVLRSNWKDQLAHQINSLPPVEIYIDDLRNAIAWWLQPEIAVAELLLMPQAEGVLAERQFYPQITADRTPSVLDYIRRAARNRFLVLVEYKGSQRLVEPYSLRYSSPNNEILHVWELQKDNSPSNMHKSFITDRITYLSTSDRTFIPKWLVEL